MKRLYPKEKFKFYNGLGGTETEPKEFDIYFNKERRFPWFKSEIYQYEFLQNEWLEK